MRPTIQQFQVSLFKIYFLYIFSLAMTKYAHVYQLFSKYFLLYFVSSFRLKQFEIVLLYCLCFDNFKLIFFSCRPRYGVTSALYFFYSFGFLLGRTVAVSLYAAWINEESREPLKFLHSVPSEYYCHEVGYTKYSNTNAQYFFIYFGFIMGSL